MEQETKKCPYCGGLILAVAERCRYCGEWLNVNNHETSRNNEYLIIVNGQQQGPFTIDALRNRHITPNTFVWTYGMSNWMPASQVSELQSLFVVQTVNHPQYQPTAYPGGVPYQQTVFQQPVQPSYQQPTNVSGIPYQQATSQQSVQPQNQPTINPGGVPYQQTVFQQPVQPSYQQPTNVSGVLYQQATPQQSVQPQNQPTAYPGGVPYQQTMPQQPETEDYYDSTDDEEGPSRFKIVCVIIGIAIILFAILDLTIGITNIPRITKYLSLLGGAIVYLGLRGEED